jgi:hypothetical protein
MGWYNPAEVSDNRASVDAIYQYFIETVAKTPDAQSLKREFFAWYDGLWVVGSDEDYKRATNFRNDFNRANASTPQQAQQVNQVIQTAVDMPGRPDLQGRKTSDGNFEIPNGLGPGSGQLGVYLKGAAVGSIGGAILAAVIYYGAKLYAELTPIGRLRG